MKRQISENTQSHDEKGTNINNIIKLEPGRNKSEDIADIIFSERYKIKELRLIMSNFDFKIFEFLVNCGVNLIEITGIEILISAGRSGTLYELFKNFQKYSVNDKEEILLEEIFRSIQEVSSETLKTLQYLYQKKILNIKLGFTRDGEVYINDEVIINNQYTIIGNFNNRNILENSEYYYVLTNKEVQSSLKTFQYKFNNSYPFDVSNLKQGSNESLSSLLDLDINPFNLYEFISNLFEEDKESEDKNSSNALIPSVKEEDKTSFQLRDYQREAIDELIVNNFNGKVQMATGTGKTLTALCGLKEYLEGNLDITNITLVVPLKLLVEQWEQQIKSVFGSEDMFAQEDYKIYKCFSEEKEWQAEIENYVGVDKKYKCNFILFVDDSFSNYIKGKRNIEILKSKNSMLIVDEAHNLTKENLRIINSNEVFKSKLALSATIYGEDKNKNELIDTNFKGTNIVYDIKDALDNGYLCQYQYLPQIVDLNSDEIIKYKDIRNKIEELEDNDINEKKLLELRNREAELISKAHRKVECFEDEIKKIDDKNSILVYSNRGNYGNEKYIDHVTKLLNNKGITTDKIVGEVGKNDRKKIIESFENGDLSAITAIKCLDEGVDIPSVKRAFLLYSGGQSKEYVQRRGRILRKFKGKEIAYIHDYIVRVDGVFPDREINRFKEYASVAKNKSELETFLGEKNGK